MNQAQLILIEFVILVCMRETLWSIDRLTKTTIINNHIQSKGYIILNLYLVQ